MKYHKNSPEWLNIVIKSNKWFSYESMKFFGSRILWSTLTPVGKDWLFITSEDNYDRTERLYSIRKATNEDGVTDTLSWQESGSLSLTGKTLREIVKKHELESQHPECNTLNR